MSQFKQVATLTIEKVKAHQGHTLLATAYGKPAVDYALECEDCKEVLADWEKEAGR